MRHLLADWMAANRPPCVSLVPASNGAASPRPNVPSASPTRTSTLAATDGAPPAMAKGSVSGRSIGSASIETMSVAFIAADFHRESLRRQCFFLGFLRLGGDAAGEKRRQ